MGVLELFQIFSMDFSENTQQKGRLVRLYSEREGRIMTWPRKKIWIAVGIATLAVVGLIYYAALSTAWEDSSKVVETKRGEVITFNVLQEHSENTIYQSGCKNLSEEAYQKEFPEGEGLGFYGLDIPKTLPSFKHSYELFQDDPHSLRFYGEIYQWETEPYQDVPDITITLDRSERTEVKADRGYVLVELYRSQEPLDSGQNSFLTKSEVNGKKIIAETLSDYYYSNRKSYRIWIDKIDGKDITALIMADNVEEDYVVDIIEFLAGVEGASL